MSKKSWYIIFCGAMLIGFLTFCYLESWIIFMLPHQTTTIDQTVKNTISQDINIYFFKHNRWQQETTKIIINDDKAQNLHHILSNFFIVLDDEQITSELIVVESVALNSTQTEAFISLSHNPLPAQASTHDALVIMQALLKTIKLNNIELQSVRFLVHHQPLMDHRINFHHSWPMCGYLKN